MNITGGTIRQIAPNAQLALVEPLAAAMARELPAHGITTPLRVAHFLAQAAHETAGFRTLVEYGNTAYFARYDGRQDLGNTQPGDGPRYRGRGIFQLTGRYNYRTIGRQIGVDLEAHPERAAEPALSVKIACLYWNSRGISPLADRDDVVAVTRKINGGTNGLDDRKRYLTRAKAALGPPEAPIPKPSPLGSGVPRSSVVDAWRAVPWLAAAVVVAVIVYTVATRML